MGPRFSRLVHAAISVGSLAVAGCGSPPPCEPDDGAQLPDEPTDPGDAPEQAPVLLEMDLLSGTTLELRFSKPMAAINDVDPQDFRISLATTRTNSSVYGCTTSTVYTDLGQNVSAVVTSVWNVPSDLRLVRVALSSPITPAHCITIDNAQANGNEGGLLLHYAVGDGASVQDMDGNQLEDIAAPWVLAATGDYSCGSYSYYGSSCTVAGMFPNMDSFVPIPCPRG
jgi:hypothetical protein